jgi:hypothetical protein
MYGEMCAIGASACTTIPEASAPAAAEASPSVARSSTVAMVWEQQQGKQAGAAAPRACRRLMTEKPKSGGKP